MRYLLLLTLALGMANAAEMAPQPELETVAAVDWDRYLGRWYELARLPNKFQDDCTGNVTAHYAKQDDGKIQVVNECSAAEGKRKRAEGEARQVGPAKLEVRFAPKWLGFLPMVWGDYWVIDLADDYSWAVVGSPERDYFWILSRMPRMDEDVFKGIVSRAQAKGFDLAPLIRTEQGGGL